MLPKTHSKHFPGMKMIRPLYLMKEREVPNWCVFCGMEFLRCACRMTENSAEQEHTSTQFKVKKLIAELARENPLVKMNI